MHSFKFRVRTKFCVRTILLGSTVLFLSISSANAALLAFADRSLRQAAVGGSSGDLSDNFNSITQDIEYGPAPVTQGFQTSEVVNGVFDESWRIDALPDRFTSIPNVDGTTHR